MAAYVKTIDLDVGDTRREMGSASARDRSRKKLQLSRWGARGYLAGSVIIWKDSPLLTAEDDPLISTIGSGPSPLLSQRQPHVSCAELALNPCDDSWTSDLALHPSRLARVFASGDLLTATQNL